MNAEISNIDITILAQKPKLAPFREAMEAKIAKLLDLPSVTSTSRPPPPIISASSEEAKASARWRWC